MRTQKLASLLFMLALVSPVARAAGPDLAITANAGGSSGNNGAAKSFKLQGRAEVQEQKRDPRLDAWQNYQANVNYQRGGMALAANDFKAARGLFKLAADGFADLGDGRGEATARFAMAQAARLDRQDDEAQKQFALAVDMFKKYDPKNPFLRAGQGYLDELGKHQLKGKASTTQLKGQASTTKLAAQASTTIPKMLPPLEGKLDNVDRHVVLQGKTMQLIANLKDDEVFQGAKLQSDAAKADLSDNYVKDRIYKGFVKMTCLEFAALGGNYYTAPDSYKPLISDDGNTVVIGATDGDENPGIRMKLNNKAYNVSMYLPGLAKSSRNVLIVTDNNHVLAIDPRKEDIWKLVPVFNKNGTADFSWWKLTHVKRNNNVSCTAKAPPSPFARTKASK